MATTTSDRLFYKSIFRLFLIVPPSMTSMGFNNARAVAKSMVHATIKGATEF